MWDGGLATKVDLGWVTGAWGAYVSVNRGRNKHNAKGFLGCTKLLNKRLEAVPANRNTSEAEAQRPQLAEAAEGKGSFLASQFVAALGQGTRVRSNGKDYAAVSGPVQTAATTSGAWAVQMCPSGFSQI